MVVTTVVFVAGAVLLTDGNLAAFPNSGRHSAEGVTSLSDSNINLTQTALPMLINRTFRDCSGQNKSRNIQLFLPFHLCSLSEKSLKNMKILLQRITVGGKEVWKIVPSVPPCTGIRSQATFSSPGKENKSKGHCWWQCGV